MTKRRHPHNPDAIEDGPSFAQHPSEWFPVAYRVRITGIVIADSSHDSDEEVTENYDPQDLAREMYENGSLGVELVRLTDAAPVSPEVKEERRQKKLKEAQEWWDREQDKRRAQEESETQGNPSCGSFEAMSGLVSGIYEAQGILPSKEEA
jgi:hypothetical protein